jgi:hypothetical protein
MITIVSDLLAEHYATHGLPPDGGATDRWFRVHIGSFTLRLPNPPARRRAVFLHDVNHLVTGYDTTFTGGEMAIAGFEVGAGCGTLWMVWYINLTMLALGLIACPRDVFAAFVRGRRSTSVYRCAESPARLAAMSLTDVRRLLRLDRESRAPSALDRVSFLGWAVLAISVLAAPAFIGLAMLGTLT